MRTVEHEQVASAELGLPPSVQAALGASPLGAGVSGRPWPPDSGCHNPARRHCAWLPASPWLRTLREGTPNTGVPPSDSDPSLQRIAASSASIRC